MKTLIQCPAMLVVTRCTIPRCVHSCWQPASYSRLSDEKELALCVLHKIGLRHQPIIAWEPYIDRAPWYDRRCELHDCHPSMTGCKLTQVLQTMLVPRRYRTGYTPKTTTDSQVTSQPLPTGISNDFFQPHPDQPWRTHPSSPLPSEKTRKEREAKMQLNSQLVMLTNGGCGQYRSSQFKDGDLNPEEPSPFRFSKPMP